MDTITKAIPLDDYKIEVLTSSGISGVFDVKPYLGGSAFKELADESYFRLVHPAHHGIMWPNEQDFSSDTIIWDIQKYGIFKTLSNVGLIGDSTSPALLAGSRPGLHYFLSRSDLSWVY